MFDHPDFIDLGAHDNAVSSIQVEGGEDCVAILYSEPLGSNGCVPS